MECQYLKPGTSANPDLTSFNGSTNGIAEYTASNFDGVLDGHLLLANYNGSVVDVKVDSTGAVLSNQTLLSNVSTHPLSLATQGDTGAFPGVIFVGDNATGSITVFEPTDFGGGANTCTGLSGSTDDDGDGYTAADEIANHTNPCSAGSVASDWNRNSQSDLIDSDDDAVAGDPTPRADTTDPFAIDPHNGTTMTIPFVYTWDNGEQPTQSRVDAVPERLPRRPTQHGLHRPHDRHAHRLPQPLRHVQHDPRGCSRRAHGGQGGTG